VTRGRDGQPGVLELRVAGPAALLVQHQAEDILARVNLFLGAGTVGKLRIAQGPVKPLGSAPANRQPTRPPPLPAAAEAELAASLEAAPEGLKSVLQRLGRTVMMYGRTNDSDGGR